MAININDLTIGQAREISEMFPPSASPKNVIPKRCTIGADLIGSDVLVRTNTAGVHFGTLAEFDGELVRLEDSRRIWSWEKAFTLSEISKDGLGGSSKLSCTIANIILIGAIEIIPCSSSAASCMRGIKSHE